MEDVSRLSYSREDIQYFRVKARDQSDFSVTSDEEYCDDEIPLGLHKILVSTTMLAVNQVVGDADKTLALMEIIKAQSEY